MEIHVHSTLAKAEVGTDKQLHIMHMIIQGRINIGHLDAQL